MRITIDRVTSDLLSQTEGFGGKEIYPDSCKIFSSANAFNTSGYSYDSNILDIELHLTSKIGLPYTEVLEDVFLIEEISYHSIPAGLSEERFEETVGENPSVLFFNQSDFWCVNSLKGEHGVSYAGGVYSEPYMPRAGKDFSDIVGRSSDGVFENNLGGLYFTVEDSKK